MYIRDNLIKFPGLVGAKRADGNAWVPRKINFSWCDIKWLNKSHFEIYF